MEIITEDEIKINNLYYIEYKYHNNKRIKHIGHLKKIIKYTDVNYYYFEYSKNIRNIDTLRINGSNSFITMYTKLYKPIKNKLLFIQIMRQKIKDIFLIDYLIKIFF